MHTDSGAVRDAIQRDMQQTLANTFGFDQFREGQEAVISRILGGRSVLAVFPTGAGKSLCYQLPALLLDGLTVVISPLIALMKDQLDFLISKGVPAGRLDSSLTQEEYLHLFDRLRSGQLKLLYIAPERLGNERFLETIRSHKISLLTIDEAHCISEWGHNFRPDYLKIADLARELKVERVLALTATATPAVAEDICKAFGIAADDVVHTGFYRPNLRLAVTPCTTPERDGLLLQKLRERPAGPAIVYVTLQQTAEGVAAYLQQHGLSARAYHAGMKDEDRAAVQNAFMAGQQDIIVATIAFGMGIDKSNIRYIYHYNPPKGLESYSQEIGRAGRDGKPSLCEMFVCADDAITLENFSHGDTPDEVSVASFVREIVAKDDLFDVSEYELSAAHDIRPLVVKTLLTYLELEGIIASTGPFYSAYKFQPQRSSGEIFERVGAERAEFLKKVFRHSKKGTKWFTLDVDQVSDAIGEPRKRIVAALGYLEEVGDFVVQASGVRRGYRMLQRPEAVDALIAELSQRFQIRESRDIDRIQDVLALATHEGCITQRLLKYFGESRGPCGHCARCEGIPLAAPAPSTTPPWKMLAPDELAQLRRDGNGALDRPRQQARFLCGLVSPALTRNKLKSHPRFGIYGHVPFREVMAVLVESAHQ